MEAENVEPINAANAAAAENNDVRMQNFQNDHDYFSTGGNDTAAGRNANDIVVASTSHAAAARAVNAAGGMNTPVRARKRVRLSLKEAGKCISKETKKDNETESDSEDADEGLICPICLDTWEMTGTHRLVSLRCGHLFGDSCIRRWLVESSKQSGIKACPQCKARATNRDIRCLFAKRVRALDRSEEHSLRDQLAEERKLTKEMQILLSTIKLSQSTYSIRIKQLERENAQLRQLLSGECKVDLTVEALNTNAVAAPSQDNDSSQQRYKLHLATSIEVSREKGCRVMCFADKDATLIVSQKSSQQLFPGYGLRLIDANTLSLGSFIYTSPKMLRDIALSNDQQQATVAGMETRVKIFDLRTSQYSNIFQPGDKQIWSCAMDRNDRDKYLYLGAQHGSTFIYDMRQPAEYLSELKVEEDRSPVISIAPVPNSETFPNGGMLVCKLQTVWFYEFISVAGNALATRIQLDGPFLAMNFDPVHQTLLISVRANSHTPDCSRYIFGVLDKLDGVTVMVTKATFFGSKTTPVMTRATQITVDKNESFIASYVQDVQLLKLYSVRRQIRMQSVPISDIVFDTCPVRSTQGTFIAALTESKCRLYALTAVK